MRAIKKQIIKTLAIILALTGISLSSCQKEAGVRVAYRTTMAISPYLVTYLDENGVKISETVIAQSTGDSWQYSFVGQEGDIIFITAKYSDPESSVKVQILVDGKIYKENSSTNDTLRYVTVSGTIPFD